MSIGEYRRFNSDRQLFFIQKCESFSTVQHR
uniref:Uncharacterized protein n=1 Tax=Anguilla anguilla TaxID=7936 RepID=A0A0E9UC80_ANGAN